MCQNWYAAKICVRKAVIYSSIQANVLADLWFIRNLADSEYYVTGALSQEPAQGADRRIAIQPEAPPIQQICVRADLWVRSGEFMVFLTEARFPDEQ